MESDILGLRVIYFLTFILTELMVICFHDQGNLGSKIGGLIYKME